MSLELCVPHGLSDVFYSYFTTEAVKTWLFWFAAVFSSFRFHILKLFFAASLEKQCRGRDGSGSSEPE